MLDAAPTTDTAISDRPSSSRIWTLVVIVTASGFAGLGYEMTWTRMFSVSLGTEMMAVLGSIAGFFAGLALGAFLLDARIRRARSPWIVYAALEAVIGAWGLASIWLLPAAGHLVPRLLGVSPSPVALWLVSFALPVLALLPATVAMGGTLTALERMLAALSQSDRVSAGVYGANTAGAVAGTLLSTFCLFPACGLSGTLACLAALNFICAISALGVGRRVARGLRQEGEPSRIGDGRWSPVNAPGSAAEPTSASARYRLGLTLFATGLLGIAVEVLVVRLAAQTLQNTIYTFASLLAAYLLGTAAGGLIWQRIGRTTADQVLTSNRLLGATSLAILGTAALAPFMAKIAEGGAATGIAGEFVVAVALFLIPSAIMGALFGYLAQEVRDARGSLGWAVGINSVGAAGAPFVATQMLIPAFGAWRALVVIAIGYLALVRPRRATVFWLATPALLALVLLTQPLPSLIRVPAGGTQLAVREGPMVTASAVSDGSGARYLEVNGHFRMGGTNSVRSDYRQAMLPLLLHPEPRRALFLGVGTGATLVGGARMPNTDVLGVELSREVVELLPWFTNPAVTTPQPRVTVGDARRYVVADTKEYDVVIADLFHPALDGSGALYTREHFKAVRERLAPGGLFCQWLPLYQLDLPSLQAIVRTFLEVYPEGSAWLNHLSVRTPMLVLVGPRDHLDVSLAGLERRLHDAALSEVTQPVGLANPMDVLGQYVGGPRALAAFAGSGPRNTDDYPFVALDARKNVRALTAPPWALLLGVIQRMQADPGELVGKSLDDNGTGERWRDGGPSHAGEPSSGGGPSGDGTSSPESLRARLTAYWHARDRFIVAGTALEGDPRGRRLIDVASPGLLEAVRLSAEFDPAYKPLIAMARSLLDSDRPAARRLLLEIDQAAPTRSEARELLASEFQY
jgi:spermidine synthase